jgi:hypothetical protein
MRPVHLLRDDLLSLEATDTHGDPTPGTRTHNLVLATRCTTHELEELLHDRLPEGDGRLARCGSPAARLS